MRSSIIENGKGIEDDKQVSEEVSTGSYPHNQWRIEHSDENSNDCYITRVGNFFNGVPGLTTLSASSAHNITTSILFTCIKDCRL